MDTVKVRKPSRFEDPLSLIGRAITRLHTLWIRSTYPLSAKGKNLSIFYPIIMSRPLSTLIAIGNSVIIRKDAWLNIVDDGVTDVKLVIDDNCLIGARDTISAKNHIHIERDVIIGTSVLIQDHHHAYENIDISIRNQGVTAGGRITIGSGCWIGKGAAIVCNEGELVIGRNSVIGANSLVTRSFPPYSVIVGNPCRLARQYNPAKEAWVGGEAGRIVKAEVG
ncbi:MAG TPA: acyltransferase [Terracidiphilus sp.]|jgi:acetyltransferase-like isoleucine patch superfamily enzyme|nr:acyltransferase [Terracidiphilus sp.]